MSVTIQVDLRCGSSKDNELDFIKEEVEGNTVGECLNKLIEKKPDIHNAILTKKDTLKMGIMVFINRQLLPEKPLIHAVKDGAKVYFIAGAGSAA